MHQTKPLNTDSHKYSPTLAFIHYLVVHHYY